MFTFDRLLASPGALLDPRGGPAVSQGRFDDQRIAVGPVMAAAGEQTHALVRALNDQAVIIVLDLAEPIRAGWNLVGGGRQAALEGTF
jgi:hypothetical protein